MQRLADRRIAIIGASSGIGRAIAIAADGEGARVAVLARREAELEDLAGKLGPDAIWRQADVRDAVGCGAQILDAIESLGGLDVLVYTVGIANAGPLRDATSEAWADCAAVNFIGAANATRTALSALRESHGRALFVSSISTRDQPPRRGLGLYSTTKTALNWMVEVWQEEEPEIAFTNVLVGDTGATDFSRDWDMEVAAPFIQEWVERDYLYGRMMMPEDVARHVIDLVAQDEAVPLSTLVPRRPRD